jgi:hypothetical protein
MTPRMMTPTMTRTKKAIIMKLGKEWFKKLSEVEQIEFKTNIGSNQRFDFVIRKQYPSFYDFIGSAFIFFDTNEGKEYWDEVAHRETEK